MVQPIYYPDPTTTRIIGIGYRRSLFGRLVMQLLIETEHRHPLLDNQPTRTVTTRRDARTNDAPGVTAFLKRAQPELSMVGGFVFRVPRPPLRPVKPTPPPGSIRRECDPPPPYEEPTL